MSVRSTDLAAGALVLAGALAGHGLLYAALHDRAEAPEAVRVIEIEKTPTAIFVTGRVPSVGTVVSPRHLISSAKFDQAIRISGISSLHLDMDKIREEVEAIREEARRVAEEARLAGEDVRMDAARGRMEVARDRLQQLSAEQAAELEAALAQMERELSEQATEVEHKRKRRRHPRGGG